MYFAALSCSADLAAKEGHYESYPGHPNPEPEPRTRTPNTPNPEPRTLTPNTPNHNP